MSKNKPIRLKQYFTDDASYNNLINVYKMLRGKENLHLRLFLKAIVICCLNAQEENQKHTLHRWQTPDSYFSPNGYAAPYYSDKFNIKTLESKYKRQINSKWTSEVFGQYPIDYIKQMI